MTIQMNGGCYVIASVWDALCVIYAMNLGKVKLRQIIPKKPFNYEEYLIGHLKQIARWILILKPDPCNTIPTTLNMSWKLITRQKKIKVKLNVFLYSFEF